MSAYPPVKFTPGPWYVYQHHPGALLHVVPCKEPTVQTVQICSANGWTFRPEAETRANFDLIAAAPDLYVVAEASEEILRNLQGLYALGSDERVHVDFLLEHTRAALAKANGKP